MRNLKKILALALALIMSLSLVTTAGAFSDDGDINANYQDAIDVLSGLDVFKGYSDGSFQPKGSITRAEVAAIIYRIDTGDVTDSQASIYSTWGKFKDVADGAWYAGYVNYCANAEYIKGRGNGVFDPQATVTGYEALAMILRAVGYDKNGEFTGSNWQVRTASIGRERGILKNVTEGLLGQAASRELVAEILFRSIIIPKVEFNANTLGYKLKGDKETIGYESFKLEKITGIVTGNEFADLENSKTMNEGKTRMIVDGSKYIVDYSTGVDDLGEERSMYITNANTTSAKFLVLEDSDKNVTFETLDKKGIGSDGDFKSVTGLQRGASTQQFLNFEEVQEWKSDYKISYILTSEKAFGTDLDAAKAWVKEKNLTSNFTFEGDGRFKGDTSKSGWYLDTDGYVKYGVEFRIGDAITGIHRANIEEIFNVADKFHDVPLDMLRGEVYVGTTSLKDISDELSLKQFVEQYINNTEGKISDNENGNWLKVIDNDNDGQADYVFKIVYTMAQVVRAKDGKYGLDTEDRTLCGKDAVNEITRDDAVSDDTLGLGDVVYYTFIDDVIRAYKAETASVKVDTVNRKDLKITTSDGTEYTESGVCGTHVLSKEYNCGVVYMNGSATYDIFLDRGGYLALFTDSNAGDFKLIVDGWYNSTKNGIEYAARVYNDETGRQDVVDITNSGSMFIDSVIWGANTVLNNDWGALKWLGGVNVEPNRENTNGANGAIDNTPAGKLNGNGIKDDGTGNQVKTTVATLTGDGVIQPVDYVSNSNTGRTVRMLATEKNAIPTSAASYNATVYSTGYALTSTDTAYDIVGADVVEVRALANTVYYFVYPRASAESGFAVERYVGYSSVPSVNSDYVEDVYAVATQQDRVSTLGKEVYYTANVVVVELTRDYKGSAEEVFIYNMPLATANVQIENVDLIHADGTKEENVKIDFRASNIRDYRVALPANWENWSIPNWNPGLYYMYPTNAEGVYTVEKMSPDAIAELGYAVGWVGTSIGTLSNNYVSVVTFDNTATANGNGIAYNMTEPANASNSNIYTLSYNDKGLADLGVYAGSEGWIQKYLGEKHSDEIMAADRYTGKFPYDHTPYDAGHDSWWNQNRVLVHYAGNGSIQYAISFANRDGDRYNAARYVWQACRPSSNAWANSSNIDRTTALKYADFMQRYGNNPDYVGRYNISNVARARMAVTVYDLRKANNDTDAMDAIEKLLNGHVDGAVVTAIGKDALLNVLTYANTTGSLDDEIAFVRGGGETDDTVTVVDTEGRTVATDPATVTFDEDGNAEFTITAEKDVKSVAGSNCAAELDEEDGVTVTVTGAVEGAKVVVTFAEEPGETTVDFVIVDEEDETKDVEGVEAELVEFNEDETAATVAVTITGDYEIVSVGEDGEEDENGNWVVSVDAGEPNTVTIVVRASTPSEGGKVTVTLKYETNGTLSQTTKTLTDVDFDADGKMVISDLAPTEGHIGSFTAEGLRGPNGEIGAEQEDGTWTITVPGLEDGGTVELIVVRKSSGQSTGGQGEGGIIGERNASASQRARTSEGVRTVDLEVLVGQGREIIGVDWADVPEGKMLQVFDKSWRPAVGETYESGGVTYDIWLVKVTLSNSINLDNNYEGLDIQFVIVDKDETPVEPQTIKAYDESGVYKFYGYGPDTNQLNEEQVKTALAAAIAKETRLDLTAEDITFTMGDRVASYSVNGQVKNVILQNDDNLNSYNKTGRLYAGSYDGKVLFYEKAGETVKIDGLDAGAVKPMAVGEKMYGDLTSEVRSTIESVANGSASVTVQNYDAEYVNVVTMTAGKAGGQYTPWNFYDEVDGSWKSVPCNSTNGYWAAVGTRIRPSGTQIKGGDTINATGTAQIYDRTTNKVLVEAVTGTALNSSEAEFTAPGNWSGMIMVAAAKAAPVFLDDQPLGVLRDGASVEIPGAKEGDFVGSVDLVGDEEIYVEDDDNKMVVSSGKVTLDFSKLTPVKSAYRLYRASKVELPVTRNGSGTPIMDVAKVVLSWNGEDVEFVRATATKTYLTANATSGKCVWYVPTGAELALTTKKEATVLCATTDGKETDFGKASATEAGVGTLTVPKADTVLSTKEAVTSVVLYMVKKADSGMFVPANGIGTEDLKLDVGAILSISSASEAKVTVTPVTVPNHTDKFEKDGVYDITISGIIVESGMSYVCLENVELGLLTGWNPAVTYDGLEQTSVDVTQEDNGTWTIKVSVFVK